MTLPRPRVRYLSRPRRPRWNGRQIAIRAATVALVVAAVAAGGWRLALYLVNASDTCLNAGPSVVLRSGAAGECVGVTDGTFLFPFGDQAQAAGLHHVEGLIAAEDKKVRRADPHYVSVVFLQPAPADGDAESFAQFTAQLEGAYTAQIQANGRDNEGVDIDASDQKPLIQVLIASSGVDAGQYPVTDPVITSDVATQRVVAVDGISVSLPGTVAEAKDLAVTRNIPVFGSTITADDFNNIQNMVRVSPSNSQEVGPLLSWVKATLRSGNTILVKDTAGDPYSQTISGEFLTTFPDKGHTLQLPQTYDSDLKANPAGPGYALAQIALDICATKPDIVLFGGRGKDLATLIGDLTCPATIVTGDDAINMPLAGNGPAIKALASGVVVYYAGEFSPGEWATRTAGAPTVTGVDDKDAYTAARDGYQAFRHEFTYCFRQAGAPDANIALAYDAVLASVPAIRLADGGQDPPPGAVAGEFSNLREKRAVYGASGPIQFSGYYERVGRSAPQGSNPLEKLIPILEVSGHGATTFKALEQVPAPTVGGR